MYQIFSIQISRLRSVILCVYLYLYQSVKICQVCVLCPTLQGSCAGQRTVDTVYTTRQLDIGHMINGQHTGWEIGQTRAASWCFLSMDTFYFWAVELDNFEHLFSSGVRLANRKASTQKLIDCLWWVSQGQESDLPSQLNLAWACHCSSSAIFFIFLVGGVVV